ncbi:hypothetical protein [Halobacillus salinus]|uniref:hypothetical protein n=1 Tax=Halobacillus salinus TaxID=192814 RepID=UPI0009A6597B|nr:hypothetical protein [Halobacillus salinus]
MSDHNFVSTFGLGLAFFALFLVPVALAGVAIAALFTVGPFTTAVLIAVLVLAVIFTILYFVFLNRFIECVCENCHKHRK